MRKGIVSFLLLIAVVFSGYIFTNCSSAKPIQNPVVGIIQLVGSEPFLKLAINTNDKDIYFLECTKEVQAELIKNQRKVYEIIYSDVKESEEGLVLIVTRVIPLVVNQKDVMESFAPGTIGVKGEFKSVEKKGDNYICTVKVIKVLGYGSAVKPVGESSELKVFIAGNVIGNEKPEVNKILNLNLAQSQGGMNIADDGTWTLIKTFKY